MAVRQLLIVVFLLGMILSTQRLSAQDGDDDDKGDGFPIPEEIESGSSEENCAVPLLSLEGQIMVPSGLSEGILPETDISPQPVVSPSSLAFGMEPDEYLFNLESMGYDLGSQAAYILIVDFFSPAMGDPVYASHGDLVRQQAEQVAAGYGSYGASITVIPVPITIGEPSSAIADKIEIELDALAGSAVVVNMSFGLVPCEVVNESIYANNAAEYGDFIETILDTSRAVSEGDSIAVLAAEQYSCSADGNVIFVAAAGNSGLPYPFAPARFNDVISVMAYEVTSSPFVVAPAGYSNTGGDVWEVGGWMGGLVPGYVVEGTSFAAPTYSARLAVLGTATAFGSFCEGVANFTGQSGDNFYYNIDG